MEQKHALGRRKSAVARVYVVAGTGNIVVNGRPVNEYFKEDVRLGISRALCEVDKEAYRASLKAAGFLTRDAREVERKKPGQPGARRRFQFSKR